MTRVYGMPAVLVSDPSGHVALYLVRELAPGRAWLLTKPDGTEYGVERAAGWWRCTCRDWRFRGHRRPCKHVLSVQKHLTDGETATGVSGGNGERSSCGGTGV